MRTLQDQLIEKGLTRPLTGEVERKSTKVKVKREKQLTDRELADLMGVNRDRFKRGPGGAFRRR